jgi:hypothetical protein
MFLRVWRRASVLVLTVGSLLTTQSATAETSVYTKPKVSPIPWHAPWPTGATPSPCAGPLIAIGQSVTGSFMPITPWLQCADQ